MAARRSRAIRAGGRIVSPCLLVAPRRAPDARCSHAYCAVNRIVPMQLHILLLRCRLPIAKPTNQFKTYPHTHTVAIRMIGPGMAVSR